MLNGLKTEGPLSQRWCWQDSQYCSSKAKISNGMPMSKISQTHTHTECFCYQHRSPCANIIKHQVQVPQSGVVLRNKAESNETSFHSMPTFFKNDMSYTYLKPLFAAFRVALDLEMWLKNAKISEIMMERLTEATTCSAWPNKASAQAQLQILRHFVNSMPPPGSRNTGTEWQLTIFHLYYCAYNDRKAALKSPMFRPTKRLTETIRCLKQRLWHTWHYHYLLCLIQ